MGGYSNSPLLSSSNFFFAFAVDSSSCLITNMDRFLFGGFVVCMPGALIRILLMFSSLSVPIRNMPAEKVVGRIILHMLLNGVVEHVVFPSSLLLIVLNTSYLFSFLGAKTLVVERVFILREGSSQRTHIKA